MDSVPPSIPMTTSMFFSFLCFFVEVELECCCVDSEACAEEVVGMVDDDLSEVVGAKDG